MNKGMFKHPEAPNLSRGFHLVSTFVSAFLAICTVGACATQTAAPQARNRKRPVASAERTMAPTGYGEGLQMRAEQGSIDRDDAEAAITAKWQQLTACYQQAGPAMAFAEGGVKLRFEVAVNGQTTSIDIVESDLGNHAVETCLMAAARAVRFPRPHGGGTARVEYTMEFRSTDERPVLALPIEAMEELRSSLLAQVFVACGALGSAELSATVYVDRRGHVVSSGLASPTRLAPERASCAAAAMNNATLPPPPALNGEALARLSAAMTDEALIVASNAAITVAKSNARGRSKERLATKARRRR